MNGVHERIESLDYLRGIMALSVMSYHYAWWSGYDLTTDSLLSKLGIYAVSTFYILSGLSLTIVYRRRMSTLIDAAGYLIKRVFRILPLFWLAVTAALALHLAAATLHNHAFHIGVYRLLLNYSLLFGFIDPGAYVSTGAWSIGNEVVFYVTLPVLFLMAPGRRYIILLAWIFSILIGIYFALFAITATKSLVEQWHIYIEPLNQIFLFLGGVVIGTFTRPHCRWQLVGGVIGLSAVLLFWLYPVTGDRVILVTGSTRFILATTCFAIVWAVYATNLTLSGFAAYILSFFGRSCYSIYLMHPLVAIPTVFLFRQYDITLAWAYLTAAAATLGTSWVTFKFIEEPLMRAGTEVVCKVNALRAQPA